MTAVMAVLWQGPEAIRAAEGARSWIENQGSFALLCVILFAGGFGAWIAAKKVYGLMSDFLLGNKAKAIDGLLTKVDRLCVVGEKNLDVSEKLLAASTATNATVTQWGDPRWLRDQLEEGKRREEAMQRLLDRIAHKLDVSV